MLKTLFSLVVRVSLVVLTLFLSVAMLFSDYPFLNLIGMFLMIFTVAASIKIVFQFFYEEIKNQK